MLYVGTTDGNVWRSLDADAGSPQWDQINLGLPDRYVTDVEASFINPGVVAVSHSGYRDNDLVPHIHLSDDYGDTWTNISGDLPNLAINDIEMYQESDSLIFVATEGGVYFTHNLGASWERLGNNMPAFNVADLEFDYTNSKLIAGTFCRSMLSISIDSLIQEHGLFASAGQDVTICEGDSVTLGTNTTFNYTWTPANGLSCTDCPNPVASPSTTTTYLLEVSNGSASVFDSVTVSILPAPSTPDITQIDAFVLQTSASSNLQWYVNGIPLAGETGQTLEVMVNGAYTVVASNSNGCSSTSLPFPVGNVGVDAPAAADQLRVWPNPVTEYLVMDVPEGLWVNVLIYDTHGRLVRQHTQVANGQSVDIGELPKGVYWVRLENGAANTVTKVLLQ